MDPFGQDVPIFVGSLHESKSLDKFTGQTQVLLSLAGPFAVFGEPIVASCVRMGTHYCDSTGTAAGGQVLRERASSGDLLTSVHFISIPYGHIAGEAVWVKHMVQKYHSDAVAKGVNIVHCCAYDSVPADLGTLLVVEHMRQVHGR